MRASVVVPTHRGAHRLPRLLDAMVDQDIEGEWELLVAVDGVLDETLQVLDAYRDRLPIRSLVHEESRGVVAALNEAFDQAGGEVLIRCDDDLVPDREFISRHVAHHDGRTDIAVIGPTRDVFPDTPYARAYGCPANKRLLAAAYERAEADSWIGWAANNSVHRDTWAKSGGFDVRFVYGQDSELGWRLKRNCAVTFVVDPNLQVDHLGPSTAATTRVPRAYVAGASKRLFYRVHPEQPAPEQRVKGVKGRIWWALTGVLARLVTTESGYATAGRALDKLLAILPTRLGFVLTALCVEAAALSGMRNGADDLAVYKKQKADELARELAARRRPPAGSHRTDEGPSLRG